MTSMERALEAMLICAETRGRHGQNRLARKLEQWRREDLLEANGGLAASRWHEMATALDEAIALLRECEWEGYDDVDRVAMCPVCAGLQPTADGDRGGHFGSCRLAAFLAKHGGAK